MKSKNGFTLVELLAVIVILAIILVIAVPQINKVIQDSRKDSLASSVKMMASSIETKYMISLTSDNPLSEVTGYITECPKDAAKWDTNNGACKYNLEADENDIPTVSVQIIGAGKFDGLTAVGTTATVEVTTP